MFEKRIRKPLADESATYQSGNLLPGGSQSFEKLVSEFSLTVDTQVYPYLRFKMLIRYSITLINNDICITVTIKHSISD